MSFVVIDKMKHIILILSILLISSCQNPDDGRESFTDKHEWSILQGLEYSYRSKKNVTFDIIEKPDYSIAVIPNKNGTGAVLIMLNPKSAPFYIQMPDQFFTLSKENFNEIFKHKVLISTVEQALRLHVVPVNQKQASTVTGR